MKGPAVIVRGLSKTFPGGVAAVDGLDLDLAPERFTALIGPSGCGKTTILRLIGGLETADSGSIQLSSPSRIGICFQEPRLLPWRTVLGNVALPLDLEHAPRDRAHRAIELVGLSNAADRLPAALSGGMRMRAALARSLVLDPELLLLDEPFGALDEVTRFRIDEDVAQILRDRGATVLLVTHSIAEAIFLADEVVVLSSQPAKVVERFTIDFPERTAALRATSPFASMTARVYEALRRGMEVAS
jgi:NitT/TauT family transport system ATP-binding protein